MSKLEQIERLAKYIIIHVPGEPSRSEGAVDTAIRILQEQAERIKELELDNRRLRQLKEDMDCETGITDPMMAWRDEKTRADAAEQREQRLRAAIEQELQAIKDLVGETEFALRQRVAALEHRERQLRKFVAWAEARQPNMLALMRQHGIVIDDLDNPMQKFAFTVYTELCEVNFKAKALSEMLNEANAPSVPYPDWCRHPDQCAGKSSCPEDPTCAD